MKWFKHETNSRNEEALQPLYDKFGKLKAYAIYNIIREMIAENMDHTDRCHLELRIKDWRKSLEISARMLQEWLNIAKQTQLVCYTFSNNLLRIEVPNLLQNKDEYSKKSRQTPDTTRLYKTTLDNNKEEKLKQKEAPPLVLSSPPNGNGNGHDYNAEAVEVILYFNQLCGTKFSITGKTSLTPIIARLKEHHTVAECKVVIDKKYRSWFGTDMQPNLTPECLFRPSHFESYLGALETGTGGSYKAKPPSHKPYCKKCGGAGSVIDPDGKGRRIDCLVCKGTGWLQ